MRDSQPRIDHSTITVLMPLTPDLERQLARFKRLPQHDDTWEGGIVRLPVWIDDDSDRDPHRPSAAMWAGPDSGTVHVKRCEGANEIETAVAALAETGSDDRAGHRPRTIRARGGELGEALTQALAGTGTTVEVVPDLPVIDRIVSEFIAHTGEPEALLAAPGVTVERLRAFAEAAKAFYEAAPWRHLHEDDLLRIERPEHPPALFTVMGSGGEQFGLAFYTSEDQHRNILAGLPPDEAFEEGVEWAVFLSPAWETPCADLDAWERLDLPLASARAYPTPIKFDLLGGAERPDAARLTHFEGLLRVLAQTTEAEMDAGRWARRVPTADGEAEYVLALPHLLEPPDDERSLPMDRRAMERMVAELQRSLQHESFESIEDANAAMAERFAGRSLDELPSTASTPIERAQDLAYQAIEARGRRQLQLIRQALAESPDCADAYTLLAERATSFEEKRRYYEQAVEAGARALGPSAFTDPDRPFWADVTTRPYMRARSALAALLAARGAVEEAVAHYRALLKLNPDDNQGVRFALLEVLINARRDDEAAALLEEHDEPGALWAYAGVLLALRAQDQRLARRRLRAALRANRHVSRYLTGQRALPDVLPDYDTPGKDNEAVFCAMSLLPAWEATPGAVAWLRAEVRRR